MINNKIIVCATGESLRMIDIIKKDIEGCYAYIVNGNVGNLLLMYQDAFSNLKLRHIINRMVPSILDKDLYISFNINELYFTVPEDRRHEVIKSIEKINSYNMDLKYYFVPPIVLDQYMKWNNITFYAMLMAIYHDNAKEIIIMGLDFWEGEYLTKSSTAHQKTLPMINDLYNRMKALCTYHKNIKFKLYTVSSKVKPLDNLEIIKVSKISEG